MKPVAMSLHTTLLSVLVTMLFFVSHSGSAPQNSPHDQDSQTQTETDEHKPLIHRVQLSSSGLHPLSLLPLNPSVNKVPKQETNIQFTNKQRRKRNAENARQNNQIAWLGSSVSQYNPPIRSVHVHGIIAKPGTSWSYNQRQQFPPPQNHLVHFADSYMFPPKRVLFNPGHPLDNRPSPVQPYPPRITPPASEIESSVPIELDDRFGGPLDEAEHPVWGYVESEEVQSGGNRRTTFRPPVAQQPTKPPTPPLFHRPSHGEDGEGNIPSQNLPIYTQRPVDALEIQTTTTQRPKRQLDRCVWAIISCCNPSSSKIRYACFENMGCSGAFWDKNPCSREITLAALNAAQEFYD